MLNSVPSNNSECKIEICIKTCKNIKFRRKILEEIDSIDFNDILDTQNAFGLQKVYFYHTL